MAAELGSAVVSSVASKVTESLYDSISRKISYVFKYQNYIEELHKQVEELKNEREGVQHKIDKVRDQGEEIEKVVGQWLRDVDELTERIAESLIKDEDKAKKRCFKGLCPNLIKRYMLSREAVKAARDGADLLVKGSFSSFSYLPTLHRTNSIWLRGYETFDSRTKILDEIMEALKDTAVEMIGVHGMGGVGKTTLVKKVASQALEEKLFDVVVITEVTQSPDFRRIQGEIADRLGLTFQEESVSGRADRLRDRLKKEKGRVLIILDNIWEKLDLDTVGIPFGYDEIESANLIQYDDKECAKQREDCNEIETANLIQYDDEERAQQKEDLEEKKDDQRRVKILLTSRKIAVLRNDMNIQKNFHIGTLTTEEAKNLFVKIVNNLAEQPAAIQHIAEEIITRCAGWPLAVATIANALKNYQKLHAWETTLNRLKSSNARCIPDIEQPLYTTIELSYNFLKDEEEKAIFLLCSLHTAGHNITATDFLTYGMGLDLFQGVDTLEDGRKRVQMLIDYLKDSCLLLDGDTNDAVKMHDVIHAVAVSMASKERKMFNISNVSRLKKRLKEIPKDSTAISLLYGDIRDKLPESLEYQNLKLFMLLAKRDDFLQIPDLFFERMKAVKVLILSQICFQLLPSSLGYLKDLQTLRLENCQLEDIAMVGELKNLEILSLSGSDIEQLPGKIGQLTQLRLLDLSNCSILKVVAPNVISSLPQLEELYMGNSFVQWEVEGRSNASLDELKELSDHLTALDIHVPDVQMLPQDLCYEKLTRFKIFIGDQWDWLGKFETSKTLKLKLNDCIYLGHEVKTLLKITEDLYLDEMKGVRNVLYELDGDGFPQLKHLHVQNGSELVSIVNPEWVHSDIAFPKLESLFLHNLISLEKIISQSLPFAESFTKLRIINIEKCNRLTHLFSVSITKNLPHLQEIKATDCKNLREIFGKDSEDHVHQNESNFKIEFAQLRSMKLECLPHLMSFGFDTKTPLVTQTSLATIKGSKDIILEDEPEDFSSLFHQKVVFPRLENLELCLINTENIWLDQPLAMSYCETLTSLTVKGCGGLKFLFPSSMVNGLKQLQNLVICNCNIMEGVIDTEGLGGEKEIIEFSFPKLFYMELKDLPKLTRFGTGDFVEFPLLNKLQIEGCPLKTFFSSSSYEDIVGKEPGEMNLENSPTDTLPLFDKKVVFPSLKTLILSHLDNLEMIWHRQLHVDSFCKLEEVRVEFCGKIRTVVQSDDLKRLSNFEFLRIADCGSLEQVFEFKGPNVAETTDFAHLKLKKLLIRHLPKLRHIWNNHSQGHLIFQNLELLSTISCWSMRSLFPVSIATNLKQLKELEIWSCGLEEIVSKKEVEGATNFQFPQLTFLILDNLPELKHFCLGSHTTEWPRLKKLLVYHCHKIKIFGSESCSFQKRDGERQPENPIQQPLFLLEKVIPKLERLSLNNDDINLISLGDFPPKMFYNVKLLAVVCFESAVFPFGFLQRFSSLEELRVVNSDFKELFPFDGLDEEKHAMGLIKQVRKLQLSYLHQLREIWKQDSQVVPFLQNLETLEVRDCHLLKCIMPSSVFFKNLTTLDIWRCNGLANILACSTAKSLDQLTKMRIRECRSVTEILANELGSMEEEIVFRQLKILELHCLLSLTCFCSANYAFKFQNLEHLMVIQCPKLKIFSPGVLSTPRLKRVQLTKQKDQEYFWKDDLNSTIHQLFIDMVGYLNVYLRVSEFPHLKERWNARLPVSLFCNLKSLVIDEVSNISSAIPSNLLCFLKNLETLEVRHCDSLKQVFDLEGLNIYGHWWKKSHQEILGINKLKSLKVDNCSSLRYIFTPSLLLGLVHLNKIEIINCAVIEEIITKDGEEDTAIDKIIILQLNSIFLQSLPNLTSFYSGSNILECPLLETINIKDCQKLYMDFGIHHAFPFSRKVVLPILDGLSLSSMSNERICPNYQLPATSSIFQTLTILVIDGCDHLKYLFSYSTVESLVQLKELKICNCKFVEGVIVEEEEGASEMHFPKLYKLVLKDLPKLSRFGVGNIVQFPSLKNLWIDSCPNLKSFICNSTNTSITASEGHEDVSLKNRSADLHPLFNEKVAFPSLDTMTLSHLNNLDMIWYHQLLADSFQKLKAVRVEFCERIMTIVQSDNLKQLPNFESLTITDCGSLEQVFEFKGLNVVETTVVVPLQLKTLFIDCLPKLRYIWNNDAQGLLNCQNLERLGATGCWSMKSLFPVSIATNLKQLKELKVTACGLEEIVSKEEVEGALEFVFPQLNTLLLDNLPELKGFYQGLHTIEWSTLCTIQVSKLHKINIFGSDCLGFQKRDGEPIQQPLFLLEKIVIPTLDELMLSSVSSERKGLNQPLAAPSVFKNLKTLVIDGCDHLKYLFSSSMVECLVQLKELKICNCKLVEEVTGEIEEGISKMLFPELYKLVLMDLPKLSRFGTGNMVEFSSLKHLWIESCPNLKSFICNSMNTSITASKGHEDVSLENRSANLHPLFDEKVAFPNLNMMTLSRLNNLDMIWYHQLDADSFRKLKVVRVEFCERIVTIVQFDNLERFSNFESLTITDCGSLEQVFEFKGLNAVETPVVVPLQLKTLFIDRLPKLRYIWNNDAQGLLNCQNLERLGATGCWSLKSLFPVSIATNLKQLKELKVTACGLEEIVSKEEVEGALEFVFPQLNTLLLDNLPELKGFYQGLHTIEWSMLCTIQVSKLHKINIFGSDCLGFQKRDGEPIQQPLFLLEKIVIPTLDELTLSSVSSERKGLNQPLAAPSVFKNLKTLVIDGCDHLKYLFSSSMVECLVQLKELKICNCKLVEEVTGEIEEGISKMLFPELYKLVLMDLPKLSRFSTGNMVEFSSLKHLWIESCPNLKSFICNSMNTSITASKGHEDVSLENRSADLHPLFDEKVAFPNLNTMTLSRLNNLDMIWYHQLDADSFRKLKVVRVEFCERIVTIVQFDNLERFSNFESLTITDCGSLEQVFEFKGLNAVETTVVVPLQLKTLSIDLLPKLRYIWNNDARGLLNCQNLERLGATGCRSLKSLFPVSIATNLKQLKELKITACGLEEIVSKDEVEWAPKFVFPQLNTLLLENVPELKRFYEGFHTTEWPMLKNLWVFNCHKIKIFGSESLCLEKRDQERQPENPIQQPLFLLEKVIPNLEKLSLNNNDIHLICRSNFSEKMFANVKFLGLCFLDESAVFPFGFLQIFSSLQNLEMVDSNFKELFPFDGLDEEKHAMTLMIKPIRKLRLSCLPQLREIWKQDSQVDTFLQNLETLEVHGCHLLRYIMPSSVSFKKLTTLDAWCCNGLANILSCSAAKSLVQLTTMRIRECMLVTEVIANEVDKTEEEIVFSHLSTLELHCLSSLTCFCSANYALKFPVLLTLTVIQCPQLKIFSPGVLSTPWLKRVQITKPKYHEYMWKDGEYFWKDELNSTIQQLFTDKVL